MLRLKYTWLFGSVVTVGLLTGCIFGNKDDGDGSGDGDGDGDGDGACSTGEETCECYANGTCNEGLSCLSNLCVSETPASGGGSGDGDGDGDGDGSGGQGAGTGGESTGTGGSAATNLVQNGNFADALDKWNLDLQAGGDAYYSDDGGEVCVINGGLVDEISFTLGYPSDSLYSFAVEAGVTYSFSFGVRGYGSLEAKVGQALAPYDTIEQFNHTVATSLMMEYDAEVTPLVSETHAGLAFNGVIAAGEQMCFDNVRFTAP